MSINKSYRCQFCNRGFSRKSWYDKHTCENRKKFDEKHNINLITGHKLFNVWQSRNGYLRKGKEKTQEEFMKSPFFGVFMKLVEFVDSYGISSAFQYLDWLIDEKVKGDKWIDKSVLNRYNQYLRDKDDPVTQTMITLENINSWGRRTNCEPKRFFEKVSPGELVVMVKTNKISPWVLFGYEPSLVELVDRLEPEYLHQINEYVNTTHWMSTIRNNPDQVDQIKKKMDHALNAV